MESALYFTKSHRHHTRTNIFHHATREKAIVLDIKEHKLQTALDTVHEYCPMYNLGVNLSKTKLFCFREESYKLSHVQIWQQYN